MGQQRMTDSLLYQHLRFNGERRNTDWLLKAYNSYNRLTPYRSKRKVNKDYAYGRQLKSQTIKIDGRYMTKEDYLKRMGIPPLSVNTLGKNKRVIQGQYRNTDVAPICHAVDPREKKEADIWSELLKQNMKMNRRN